MAENAIAIPLSTLIATYITKKYNMDNSMYGAIYGVSVPLLAYCYTLNISGFYEYTIYVYFGLFVMMASIGLIFRDSILLYFKTLSFNKYDKLILKSPAAISTFLKYVKTHKNMYNVPSEYLLNTMFEQEHCRKLDLSNINIPMPHTIVNFNDKNLNIEGYYVVSEYTIIEKTSRKDCNDVEWHYGMITVYIKKNPRINNLNLIDEIQNIMNGGCIKLYYVKTFKSIKLMKKDADIDEDLYNDSDIIYDGNSLSIEEGKKNI